MSSKLNPIAVYANLPSGGAIELYKYNVDYLSKRYKVTKISDNHIKPTNFIDYLYKCIFTLPKLHRKYARMISEYQFLIAYHSWLTKSPHILRYVKIPKVYICHEPMREFYEKEHKALQSLKEKFINLIRLPLKYIDKKNIKSSNTTVIVNSKFSKRRIDKAYNINSHIVYPGININDFLPDKKVIRKNQVISVGSINNLKRFEFIVQVVSTINKKIRPRLLIVGNGGSREYINNLNKLAKKLEVSLTIKTMLSRRDLKKSYCESKLFLYAPVNEPFGIVVEEAMASGLPLVVYKYGGGYVEILNNENGYILDNLSLSQWKITVEKLLTNTRVRNKISEYNKKYIYKYSHEKMNINILKILKSL